MILLGLLLLSLGAADLARPQDRAADLTAGLRAVALATLILALGAWGSGLAWWWVPIGVLVVAAWVMSTPVGAAVGDRYPWPIIILGVLVLAILSAGAHVPTPHGWLTEWYAGLGLPLAARHPVRTVRRRLRSAGLPGRVGQHHRADGAGRHRCGRDGQ